MNITPWPWELKKKEGNLSIDKRIVSSKCSITPGITIAEIMECDTPLKVWNNGRLLASAPVLLEACIEAKNYLRFNKGNASRIYDKLEKAIASAEGNSK